MKTDLATTSNEGTEVLRVLGKAHHALSVTYGVALIVAWLALQVIAFFFLIPVLSDMYADFGGELPRITIMLIDLSQWLRGDHGAQQIPGWYFALPIAVVGSLLTILLMYRIRFAFYLVAPLLLGSVFVEIGYLIGPLYQLAGNIANF